MRFSIRQLLVITLVIALVIHAARVGPRVTTLRLANDFQEYNLQKLEERVAPFRFANGICETLLNDRENFHVIEYPSNVKIVYSSKAYLAAYERFQQTRSHEEVE